MMRIQVLLLFLLSCTLLNADESSFHTTLDTLQKMKTCSLHCNETEISNRKYLLEHLYTNESCLLNGLAQEVPQLKESDLMAKVHHHLRASMEKLLESQRILIHIALRNSSEQTASGLAKSKVLWREGKAAFNDAVRLFTLELEYGNQHFTALEKEALLSEYNRIFTRELQEWQSKKLAHANKGQESEELKMPDETWRVVAVLEALEGIKPAEPNREEKKP